MAIATGWKGTIKIKTSGATPVTVAEMGTWSISGPTRNMMDISSFGDTVPRKVLGTLTGQTITFSGFWDATSSGGLKAIQRCLSSGTAILGSTLPFGATTFVGGAQPANLRLWANTDSDLPGFGHWSLDEAGSTLLSIYITNMELGQSKDGLGTVSFTAAVQGDDLIWQATT